MRPAFAGVFGIGVTAVSVVPRAAGIGVVWREGNGAAFRVAAVGLGGGDGASIAMRIDRPPNPIPTAITPYNKRLRIGMPRRFEGRE